MSNDNYEKLLTADEERKLFEHIDDPASRERIILANQRLVRWAIHRYIGMMEYDDLIQEANIALIKAVDNFDYTRGYRFATYAVHTIRRYVYRQINKSRIIRTGETLPADSVYSLDEHSIFGDDSVIDMLEAPEQEQGDKQMAAVEYAMSLLDEKEKDIVAYFFLDDWNLQDLMNKYGVSHQTLCILRDQTLRKLRRPDNIDILNGIMEGKIS